MEILNTYDAGSSMQFTVRFDMNALKDTNIRENWKIYKFPKPFDSYILNAAFVDEDNKTKQENLGIWFENHYQNNSIVVCCHPTDADTYLSTLKEGYDFHTNTIFTFIFPVVDSSAYEKINKIPEQKSMDKLKKLLPIMEPLMKLLE